VNTHTITTASARQELPAFRGRLISSEDTDYEQARKVWNGALKDNPGNELLLATLKKFSP